MQVALVLLAIVGSTAWLAVDAARRDWSENSFSKNVPTWVAGSLLLWPFVFPMYVFAHRKKAPLKNPPAPKAKPAPEPEAAVEPAPAVALDAQPPAEQYGPSLDEVEPAPVVERVVERDPVVEVEIEPDPVVELEPEPALEPEPDPLVEIEPDPVVELEPEPALEPEPDPVVEFEPEPEREHVIELKFHDGEEPVFDISRPAAEAPVEPVGVSENAPPGLSVHAFKDVQPVSFGGFAGSDDDTPIADVAPQPGNEAVEPVADVAPEPPADVAPQPVVDVAPEPPADVAPEPQPSLDASPEPLVDIQPAPMVEIDPQPLADIEPDQGGDLDLAYPSIDAEPVIQAEPEPIEPGPYEPEPHEYEPYEPYEPQPYDAVGAAAAPEQEAPAEDPEPTKARSKFNPEIKLPSFGRKKAKVAAATADAPKEKGGFKLPNPQPKRPNLSLPPNLQGPLSDVERKIALGSVLAVVAAAAFGYMSAPSEDSTSATTPPPPTATSR
jgi:hypothetical protein